MEIEKHKGSILEQYSVINSIRKFSKVKSPLQAFNSDCESLAIIRKNNSDGLCLALIQIWIVNLNDFINASKKMTPNQIEESSAWIYEDYYHLKMSDIFLLFSNIKRGVYGQLYGSIDGMKLLSFFQQYDNERRQSVFDNSIREHDKIKYKEEKSTIIKNTIGHKIE